MYIKIRNDLVSHVMALWHNASSASVVLLHREGRIKMFTIVSVPTYMNVITARINPEFVAEDDLIIFDFNPIRSSLTPLQTEVSLSMFE